MAEPLESRIDGIRDDRVHGQSHLTRLAVEIVAAAAAQQRAAIARKLAEQRPAMPAIGAAALEAAGRADPLSLLVQMELEHARVAADAARRLTDHDVVATISASALVERTLLQARPRLVEVLVDGSDDEGHEAAALLRRRGIAAAAIEPGKVSATAALVGCDAIFEDGGIVNRRGTAALVAAITPGVVVVVGDRWRRVGGGTPEEWPEPGMFEIVSATPNLGVVA